MLLLAGRARGLAALRVGPVGARRVKAVALGGAVVQLGGIMYVWSRWSGGGLDCVVSVDADGFAVQLGPRAGSFHRRLSVDVHATECWVTWVNLE